MKGFAVVLFAGCITVALCRPEEMKPEMMEFQKQCVSESGVDPALAKNMNDGHVDGAKMPEYLFCFFKKAGFMNDAGEYQTEVVKTVLTNKYNAAAATKIMDACMKETKATGPETAAFMAKCYHDNKP